MSIETTVLDFKLSNTFEEYEAHMNAPEQQAMFKEMGVKTFYSSGTDEQAESREELTASLLDFPLELVDTFCQRMI